jgi:hypothetical protein
MQDTLNHTSHLNYHLKFIIKKNHKPSLPYGEFKFERWVSKLLFLFSKRLNKKENHNSKYIENFHHQNPFKKSSLISMLYHHITIESFTH